MKKEITPPVIIGIIAAVVIVIVAVGWLYFKPGAPEVVAKRQAGSTRTDMLRRGPGQPAGGQGQ